jgi:excisionase family DNA binding protein
MDVHRETLTVAEVGRVLGICRNTVYRLMKRGIIPSLLLGRKRVVPRAAVQRLLDGAERHRDASSTIASR